MIFNSDGDDRKAINRTVVNSAPVRPDSIVERNISLAIDRVKDIMWHALLNRLSLGQSPSQYVDRILDEDDMASDSDVALATQQSIKAYVDTEVAGVTTSSNLDGGVADTDFGGIAVDADGGDSTSF